MVSKAPRGTSATASPPIRPGRPGRARTPGLARRAGRWRTRLLIVGIVLASLNLRPAITTLGPLLEDVRDGLGMSGSVAGLLTSAPPLCFAVFGAMASRLARRFGPGAVVCAGMAVITLGLALRPLAGDTAVFLAASACALMGMAVGNVLMPVIVKRWFPDRVGAMTGLYSMVVAFGTAVGAAAAVPLTGALGGGWRTGLGVWAVLGAVALVVWIPLAGRSRAPDSGPGREPAPERVPRLHITRSRTAWALAVFFGLQAAGAYIAMGWLPQIFLDAGVPADTAGLLLAVVMVMGVPLSFVIPRMAVRLPGQGAIVVALGLCGLAGYAGLYLAPAGGALAWAVLLGISNCAFPLALTLIGMRAGTGAGVAQLSAFAQSTGYLISIPGPLLVGVLYQHSGGWGPPIVLMAGLMVPQTLVGIVAGRNRTVEAECAASEQP